MGVASASGTSNSLREGLWARKVLYNNWIDCLTPTSEFEETEGKKLTSGAIGTYRDAPFMHSAGAGRASGTHLLARGKCLLDCFKLNKCSTSTMTLREGPKY